MTMGSIRSYKETKRTQRYAMPSNPENLPSPTPIVISTELHTINCVATCFGYEDPGDNGRGAWGDNNNNRTTVGVSVPPPILIGTLGGMSSDIVHSHTVTVWCGTRSVKNVRITDEGPAERIDGV